MKQSRDSEAPFIRYAKPRVLASIPLDRHAVIEASAGTGKTYTIEHLVVELLISGRASIEQILVLTYTDKAATELRRRIRGLLEKILACRKDEGATGEPYWEVDQTARERMETALFHFDLAAIDTIHAFFHRVLVEHAFAGGRLFEQELADSRTLFSLAFYRVLRSELAGNSLSKQFLERWLSENDLQELEKFLYACHSRRRSIEPEFHADMLTRLLTHGQLQHCDAARIADIKSQLREAGKNHSSIKAIGGRLDKLGPAASGFATCPDLPGFLDQCYEDIVFIAERLEQGQSADPLLDELGQLGRHAVSWKAALVQTFLPCVQKELESQKRTQGLYDFDDMISLVWNALEGPAGPDLLGSLRSRFLYGLIDEFQDTDHWQWQIFQRVFVESSGKNLLYLIGDPKQAIYAFRRADVFTYLQARGVITGKDDSKLVRLRENFRSTADLIEAYNHLFCQNAAEPFFDGPIHYSDPVECGRTDLIVHGSARGSVTPVCVFRFHTEDKISAVHLRRELGRRIAQEIRGLLTEEAALHLASNSTNEKVQARDIFILTVSHRDGEEIGVYLREAGIPHAFYKQEGLFQRPEALDVRDLLAAIDQPQDRSRRFRAWLTPFFVVPLRALPDCGELPPDHALMERLLSWQELAGRRAYEELFARLLDDTGLVRRQLFLQESERELTNYLHLFEILLEEAQNRGLEIAELVNCLQAYIDKVHQPAGENSNVQRLESERSAVQIMTMHGCKGLEAAVVFLYGGLGTAGRDGDLHEYHRDGRAILHVGPDAEVKERADEEREQEYQRLLYVAVTRARGRLYLWHLDGNWPSSWSGCYKLLNQRLTTVLGETGSHSPLFTIEEVESPSRASEPAADTERPDEQDSGNLARLSSWTPENGPWSLDGEAVFARLRKEHAAFDVTSYTRMKRKHGGFQSPLEAEEFKEDAARFAPHWLAEQGLPGGAATGTFLHEVIERVRLPSLGEAAGLADWCAKEEIAELFRICALRHGIDDKYCSESQRIIYQALTASIPLGENVVPGLGCCERTLREVEFLYPYPERTHPPLDQLPAGKWQIERGFIKGFIDFVFEFEGRVYVVDWKSDILPNYDSEMVRAHIDRNYTIQVQLYALALARMLEIHCESDYDRRFGGLLYCFLRGMRADDAASGTYFLPPTWRTLLEYEATLRAPEARRERP
jgi:exodeoxyribonuclease V beta subunit